MGNSYWKQLQYEMLWKWHLILDIELEFVGKGVNEKAFVKSCKNSNYQIEIGKEVLNIDPNYFRPNEVDLLVGDSTKAKEN